VGGWIGVNVVIDRALGNGYGSVLVAIFTARVVFSFTYAENR
jgi:hypothetical protein